MSQAKRQKLYYQNILNGTADFDMINWVFKNQHDISMSKPDEMTKRINPERISFTPKQTPPILFGVTVN